MLRTYRFLHGAAGGMGGEDDARVRVLKFMSFHILRSGLLQYIQRWGFAPDPGEAPPMAGFSIG